MNIKIIVNIIVSGFIRFLHGYYLILITRRRKVGMIGCHFVYGIDGIKHNNIRKQINNNKREVRAITIKKIKKKKEWQRMDISYIYVPPYFPKNQTPDLVDETKYKALFLGLDLTRDFYFSYTYLYLLFSLFLFSLLLLLLLLFVL